MNIRILVIICALILVSILSSCTMTLVGSSVYVDQLYQSAEKLYTQGNYESALTKYNEALFESRKSGVSTEMIDRDFTTLVNFKISVTYSRLAEQTGNANHYYTAIQLIEKIAPAATIPKHQEGITYLWGHTLYRLEQYHLADAKFLQLIQSFPNSLQAENAWYAIGQWNYVVLNYEDCRAAFRNILVNFPTSEFKDDAQLLIAQSFLDEYNFEQAYKEFDKFATEEFKNYPDLHAEAAYKAAFCFYQLDRHDEAISRYTKFIKQFPDHNLVTAAYFDQGAMYAIWTDYDTARLNYELAKQSTTDTDLQSEIQSTIGQTYFDQADYENAIPAYTKLINEYPESAFIGDAKLGMADSYFRLEHWSDAIPAYQSVIEYEKNTDREKAKLNYTPYSVLQVGDSYYRLGTNQMQAGETRQGMVTLEYALQWYQQTVDDFPLNPVAPYALFGAIWTLNDLGRKAELERVVREFIEKIKYDNEFDILAAEVQLRFAGIMRIEFKQYVEAAEEYAKLWDYPPLPKFYLVRLMGKFFEGRSYYEAAKPEGFQEGDPSSNFNTEYLQKSVAAYQEAITWFSDSAFLPGAGKGLYQDFAERVLFVEACIMNAALSHTILSNWDQARKLYKSIPISSEYYEKVQQIINKLANTDNLSVPEIGVVEPRIGHIGIIVGLTPIEGIMEELDLESSYFGVFDPLPSYQGDF